MMSNFSDLWKPLLLTESGLPQLLPKEIEILNVSSVNVLDGRVETDLCSGTVTLTSHRIIFRNQAISKSADLACIQGTEIERRRRIMRSRSITVRYLLPSASPTTSQNTMRIKFLSSGRDSFHDQLQLALSRKEWTFAIDPAKEGRKKRFDDEAGANAAAVGAGFATSGAGIGGLMRRQEREQREDKAVASKAFGDLQSLMDMAREVVSSIEYYVDVQKQKEIQRQQHQDGKEGRDGKEGYDSSGGEGGGGGGASGSGSVSSMVLNLGIQNPITRATAKKASASYHHLLAQELYDFLSRPSNTNAKTNTNGTTQQNHGRVGSTGAGGSGSGSGSSSVSSGSDLLTSHFGGVILLTDLYCLFNRARGLGAQVSPDDILGACRLMHTIGQPPPLKQQPSSTATATATVRGRAGPSRFSLRRIGLLLLLHTAAFNQEYLNETLAKLSTNGSPADSRNKQGTNGAIATSTETMEMEKITASSNSPWFGVGLSPDFVSRALGMPPTIAQAVLEEGERSGALCRDDSIEGVLYYANRFEGFGGGNGA